MAESFVQNGFASGSQEFGRALRGVYNSKAVLTRFARRAGRATGG
jgi:hypothetical protein